MLPILNEERAFSVWAFVTPAPDGHGQGVDDADVAFYAASQVRVLRVVFAPMSATSTRSSAPAPAAPLPLWARRRAARLLANLGECVIEAAGHAALGKALADVGFRRACLAVVGLQDDHQGLLYELFALGLRHDARRLGLLFDDDARALTLCTGSTVVFPASMPAAVWTLTDDSASNVISLSARRGQRPLTTSAIHRIAAAHALSTRPPDAFAGLPRRHGAVGARALAALCGFADVVLAPANDTDESRADLDDALHTLPFLFGRFGKTPEAAPPYLLQVTALVTSSVEALLHRPTSSHRPRTDRLFALQAERDALLGLPPQMSFDQLLQRDRRRAPKFGGHAALQAKAAVPPLPKRPRRRVTRDATHQPLPPETPLLAALERQGDLFAW